MIERKSIRARLSEKDKATNKSNRRTNKLNSLRFEFEAGRIKDFDQVFAIMSETNLSAELGISFYTFRKKVYDPGEFTVSEMMRMADLIGVDYQIIANFVVARIHEKQTKKRRR